MAKKGKAYNAPSTKLAGLVRIFQQWKDANDAYLKARLVYDQARLSSQKAIEGFRLSFQGAKQRVKAATEAYYAYLQAGQPLTLTQLEESKLFTPAQIAEMKQTAQTLLKEEKSSNKA